MNRVLPAGLALAALLAYAGAQAADSPPSVYGSWGFDADGMDASIPPGDDFFKYANGGWDAKTAIPADKSAYGVDYVLSDAAEQHVREILEADPRQVTGSAAADAVKIHAAYLAFMDEKRVEGLGTTPIAGDLAAIRGVKTKAELAALMGQAHDGFQDSLFSAGIREDFKAPDSYAVYLGQDGLGLPDRDYYLEPSFAIKKLAYQAYIAQMLALVGWPHAAEAARDVVALETEIAAVSWTRAERRDPVKTYNPMSPAALAELAPGFEWPAFLKAAGIGGVKQLIVAENTAFPKIAQICQDTPLPVLQARQAFGVIDAAAPYLPRRFADANFAFRSKLLRGQPVQQERWKRGVALVNRGIGEAVGRLYVAKYFPPEAKAKIDALVGDVKQAFGRRIEQVEWMDAATKATAEAKLAAFTVKIAYPDKWRDYSALKVSAGDLAGDIRDFARFEWQRRLKRLDQPVDRAEWGMTPQTVNAYYNPSKNEIVFPAAILAPPYFDPNADAAANYGGIGAVIGHEMTHGFDDEGRKFDPKGALADWWTADDAQRFEDRAHKLNAQYDTYSPFPGVHVKGDQTTGENIADLGGILIALDAYHASLNGAAAPVIDGLSGDQRFFLAYAQSWRDKRREDAVRDQLVRDVHAPEIYRVNGVVRNVDAWYDSFGVKDGAPLFLAPADRVKIW
jgi:putative endopeptidase